jgi:hypothetical protein
MLSHPEVIQNCFVDKYGKDALLLGITFWDRKISKLFTQNIKITPIHWG